MDNHKSLNCLYPKKTSFRDFEAEVNKMRSELKETNINEVMLKGQNIPYFFNGQKDENKSNLPALIDAARLYTAVDYILHLKEGKEFKKFDSYKKFLDYKTKDEIKEFLSSIISGSRVDAFKDVGVDLIKGSIYKIKKYFLENNKIKDIRGGSSILDYLNIEASYEILGEILIEECAIYCGGGNVVILAPKGYGRVLCERLEKLYFEVSLTAMNAFEYVNCTLNEFAYNYKEVSRILNDKLEERKKIKFYGINPDSRLKAIIMGGRKIEFAAQAVKDKGAVCELCKVRDAKYYTNSSEGKIGTCPSCLRKNTVGKYKAKFFDEYEYFTKSKLLNRQAIQSLNDLGDRRGYTAVIYGDGNNMGNVVRNITNPFEMMYFSRNLEEVTKASVYSSIREVMKHNAKFEVIALGGDDIFIIVPADCSLEITQKIVEKFDTAFDFELTMSAGICAAKSNTPIRNMFEIAQSRLKSAKKFQKKNKLKDGTIDAVILESNSNITFSEAKEGFFPTTSEKLNKAVNVIRSMKKESTISRGQIYKLKYAEEEMSGTEFQIFYLYQEAKNGSRLSEYICYLFDIKERHVFSGFVEDKSSGRKFSPWKDLTMLWDYVGDEKR